jgi:hypothetical protein
MQKAEEFREHADECRKMARSTSNEDHRQQLIKMAEIWESLAKERERMNAKKEKEDKSRK